MGEETQRHKAGAKLRVVLSMNRTAKRGEMWSEPLLLTRGELRGEA